MNRTNQSDRESMRSKLFLLVVEKLFLAMVIVAAGFLFNSMLQNSQLRGEYQRELYEKRVSAYISMLTTAKELRDELAILYRAGSGSLGELQRRELLEELSYRARELGNPSGFSRRSTWANYGEIIELISEIEMVSRTNDLYLSASVKPAIENFLDIVVTDVDRSLSAAEQQVKSGDSSSATESQKQHEKEAWYRAERAYREFREALNKALDIEGMVLG